MLAKAITFVTLLAAAQAGGVYYDTHVGAQSEQTIRGLGFGASTYTSQSKAVDSAFSSVRRHESRLINPAVNVATYAHAAPVATYAHAAPVATYAHAAPVATYAHAAPVATYAHAAPVATYARAATPVATSTHVASGHGLGVAYSAVPQVAHLFFDGFGAHYEY